MKIEEPWPQKTSELPIPKPQEPFPREFVNWIESRLTTKRFPRPPVTKQKKRHSEDN